jgi:hypothetical protein
MYLTNLSRLRPRIVVRCFPFLEARPLRSPSRMDERKILGEPTVNELVANYLAQDLAR